LDVRKEIRDAGDWKGITGNGETGHRRSGLSGEALVTDIMAELKKLQVSKHKFEESVEEFDKHAASAAKKASRKTDPTDTLIEEI